MKAWGRWVGLLVCAAGALLLPPAGAVAKPGYVVSPGSHIVELMLKGSHGYAIQIAERNRRYLEVVASKGPSVVLYLTHHIPARDGVIDAKLPGVGRISMRFHPAGPARTEPGFFPPCHGGKTVTQRGYFLGTVHLRGERGYTTVKATRARGKIVTTAKEICNRSIFNDDSEPEPEEDATRLFSYSRSKGRLVRFSASTLGAADLQSPNSTFFSGSVTEQRGGMVIFRQAIALGPRDDLAPGDAGKFPLTATITPPPDQFHGTAVFHRHSEGKNAWTGSLGVDLPGAGRVALAGASFSSRLCQGAGCKR